MESIIVYAELIINNFGLYQWFSNFVCQPKLWWQQPKCGFDQQIRMWFWWGKKCTSKVVEAAKNADSNRTCYGTSQSGNITQHILESHQACKMRRSLAGMNMNPKRQKYLTKTIHHTIICVSRCFRVLSSQDVLLKCENWGDLGWAQMLILQVQHHGDSTRIATRLKLHGIADTPNHPDALKPLDASIRDHQILKPVDTVHEHRPKLSKYLHSLSSLKQNAHWFASQHPPIQVVWFCLPDSDAVRITGIAGVAGAFLAPTSALGAARSAPRTEAEATEAQGWKPSKIRLPTVHRWIIRQYIIDGIIYSHDICPKYPFWSLE